MLQILRLAPSISPDMEPVVSRAKTTSTRGRGAATWGGDVAGGAGGAGGCAGAAIGVGAAGFTAAAPRRCAASAASPASTAPMMRLALTHLSLLVAVVFMASSPPDGETHQVRRRSGTCR